MNINITPYFCFCWRNGIPVKSIIQNRNSIWTNIVLKFNVITKLNGYNNWIFKVVLYLNNNTEVMILSYKTSTIRNSTVCSANAKFLLLNWNLLEIIANDPKSTDQSYIFHQIIRGDFILCPNSIFFFIQEKDHRTWIIIFLVFNYG